MTHITIGIPTFRREKMLLELLSSAEATGVLRDFPVLVVDDGPSKSLGVSISKRFPTVVFRSHSVNMGFSKSLLSLLRACNTPYLMLCADDDFLSLDGIHRANAYVSESYSDLISTQWLREGQIHRGRKTSSLISYSEIGPATRHAPGLILRVDTSLKFADHMEDLLKDDNYAAKIYPQVVLAYLIILHGGVLRWHNSAPVVEGFAAPSQLKDASGNSYYSLVGRVQEYEGFLQFFDRCGEWLDSEERREFAKHLATLRIQELFVNIDAALAGATSSAQEGFRGGALFHLLRQPGRGFFDLFKWIGARAEAHKRSSRLESALLGTFGHE